MDVLSDEKAFSSAIKMASASVLPMVLTSAIQLDLLHLIQTSHSASASASELASRLPTTNPQAPAMIDRILRLLAASSLLKCTGGAERRYSLTPVCKYFTRNEDGVSLAPLCLLLQDRVFMESWYHLKDAVVEGGVAFDRAHGVNAFQYQAKDPRFNRVFNEAMYEQSTIFMGRILEIYKGFEGVNSVVDVGGGTGASLKMIMSKYPCLKAINFDLPHVIRDAPSLPGVEHVGGDMFVTVPKAEAIFMKWICHDWSDAHCHKLLKNCYEALPENGKVIIAETTLPEDPNSWAGSSNPITGDLIMLNVNPGGKERTQKEFQTLAENAGFNQIIQVCCAFNIWIMEFHKSTT